MDKIQQINRAFYDKNALRWSSAKTDSFYAEKAFKVFLKHAKKGTILDIGCAQGREVPLFLGLGRGLGYEGLDISKRLLAIAKRRYPQLIFRYGNILEKKTLPKKKFNGFWAASTLQHIPSKDWDSMFENISGLMTKGAIGYFSVPNDRPNPASVADPRHFSILSDTQIVTILKRHGWKVRKRGVLPATRGTASWRWYIVALS